MLNNLSKSKTFLHTTQENAHFINSQPAGATKGFLFFLPTIGQHLQEEEIMKTNTKVPKTPFFAAFSVGAVLFSAHAGGGFATGNQANTYYVGLGWTGIIAVVAMPLLTLTMREAMISKT